MNRKTKKELKHKVVSKTQAVLAGVLALNTIGVVTAASLREQISKELKAEQIANATGKNKISIDGVSISLDQELNDNGDGTYSLGLKTSSNLTYEDMSVRATKIQAGYYEAEKDGSYMLEIWGGDGASGQNTIYSHGGKGGKGGHLYAVAELKAGDILFYTIGGNGQQTLSNDKGGGANGDGGDHGDTGNYYVGGGGGYTAVYKFTAKDNIANKFRNDYLDANGNLKVTGLNESDRTTKYIMIAGGGGGGGAGNGASVINRSIRTPDGGDAGSFASQYGDHDSSYTVEGRFYAGSNGFSSGKSQEFIGNGATDMPGEVNRTYVEWFAGKKPNDWEGTNNPKYPGGSGGAGNLRGGAGGAGFAGGSGGVMAGLLIGTDVGGGGGGSSFVAKSLLAPQEDQKKYISNKNSSTVGGAVYVSYMPGSDDLTYLDNLTLEGDISKYFDVVSATAHDSAGNSLPITVNNNKFSASGIKASPSSTAGEGKSSLIELKLKPVNGFMGGNDVPIFKQENVTYSYTKQSVPHTADMGLIEKCSYVNVPYAFDLTTHNYTKSGSAEEPCTELKVSDLFDDKGYVAEKADASKSYLYDFIDSVTDYVIQSDGATYEKSEQLTLSESKMFEVSYTVRPKDGSKAIVGEKLKLKTFKKNAKVTIVEIKKNELNGILMTYERTLNYNASNDTYDLALNVSANYQVPKQRVGEFTFANKGSGTYVIPETGIYVLQLWGGYGGRGGDNGYSGGQPGERGYMLQPIRLEAGQTITYTIAQNGSNGSEGSFLGEGRRAEGGKATVVSIDGERILAAAGSGGGGGALWTGPGGQKGENVSDTKTINVYSEGTGDSSQGKSVFGQAGGTSGLGQNAGGWAGVNYKNDTYFAGQSIDQRMIPTDFARADYSATNGGALYVYALGEVPVLDGYSVESEFTDNFVLEGKSISGATGTETSDGYADIAPNVTISGGVFSLAFTVTYTLSPAATCLGGYDIKLLNAMTLSQVDTDGNFENDSIKVKDPNVETEGDYPTDYANVRILPSLLDQFTLTVNDTEYIQGREAIDTSSLYSASTTFDPTGTKLEIKEASESFGEGVTSVAPNQTTDYPISYGLQCAGEAEKAVVGPNLEPLVLNSAARVTVYHEIQYELTNINVDAGTTEVGAEKIYSYTPGENYVAHLTPEVGMELPEEISVTIDDQVYTGFTWDISNPDEGELTIPGSVLGNDSKVIVSGTAKTRTFKLHYLVATDETGYSTQDYVVELEPGTKDADLDDAINGLLAKYNYAEHPIEGYTFVIEFPDGDRSTFTEMPPYDVWINGTYQPNPHTLTINYVDESGDPLPGVAPYLEPNEDCGCYNNKDIDVLTPVVEQYAPIKVQKVVDGTPEDVELNPARIQFTMPDDDVELNVVYKNTASSVVVNYQCKDPDIIDFDPFISTGTTGSSYDIPVPTVPGYTATMSPEPVGTYQANGESIIVTYAPTEYTIKFDSAITDVEYKEFDDRVAFYGHEIGYTLVKTTEDPDPVYEDATYVPLPTPVRVGYTFMGWSYGGSQVTSTTVLNKTGEITLTAMWKKLVTQVTEENCVVRFTPSTFEYDGNEHIPTIEVLVNNKILTKDVDYQLLLPLDCTSSGSKEVTVSFIGEYSGTITDSFTITPKNIPSTDLDVEDISGNAYTFTGEAITPTPYVKDGDTELICGTDYVYQYSNNVEKGNAKVTVHFIGNYANTPDVVRPFTISARDITDDGVISVGNIPTDPVPYTGTPYTPEVSVTFTDEIGTTPLVKGVDYTVVYDDNVDAGEATITIRFINNYENTPDVVKHFTIEGAPIDTSKLSVTGIETEGYTYTGSEIKPSPLTVIYDGVELVEGKDFVVSYEDNVNVNSSSNNPRAVIEFIGNYDGNDDYEIEFDINPKEIHNPTTGEPPALIVYPLPTEDNPMVLHDTGDTPDLSSIIIGDNENHLTLVEGVDYDIIIDDEELGTAHIEFKGNYEGTDDINIFFVVKAPVVAPIADQKYTGEQLTPIPVVTFNDVALVENTDYTVSYGTNIAVGENSGLVTVTFIGEYADLETLTVEVKFNIVKNTIDARDLVVSNIDPMIYDGSQLTPTPTVTYNGVTLTKDVDYELDYGENIHAGDGAGKVVITLIGGYSSENKKTVYFDILPKEVPSPTDPTGGLVIEPLPDESDPMQVPNNGKDPVDFGPITITDPVTGEELRNPEDFTLVDDGDGEGHIEFHGDYEGTPDVPFNYVLTDPEITSTIEDQPYTGEPIEPEVIVEFDGETLTEGVDYVVRYEDNDVIGEAKVIVEFIGDYEGCPDKELPFNIVQSTIDPDPSKLVIGEIADQPFTGFQITPEPSVTYNGVVLTAGKDYTYSYGENIHAGTDAGSVTISFIGGFTGEDVDKTFNILPKQVEDPTNPDTGLTITPVPDQDNPIKVPPTSGDPKLPITITDPETGEELRNPEDFTIEFDPDTGEAHIEFHGDYEGTPDVDVFYEVEEIVIDPIDDQEYTGEQSTPVPHITFNGEDLVEGEDYTIDYGDNDETGDGTIIITYIGDFADVTPNPDTITFNIVVNNMDAHDLVVDYIDPMTYTGSQLIPDNVVVKYNGIVLTEDVDYELSYGENIHAGEGNGKVIVSMIGGFESENTKTVYFDILPKEVEDPTDPDTGLIIEPLPDESDPMQIPNNGKDPIEFEEIVITDPVTGEELRNPEDFTLVDDGDGDGRIVFHGDYEGTPDVPFKYEIVDPEIETEIEDQPYTGEPIEPEIIVTFDGEELEEGVDYIVRYEDNDEVDEAKVIVEFIGDYEGCEDQEITFNIVPTTVDESLVEVADVEDQTYTGSQIKPTPEVKYNGVVLTAGKDFTYNYGENVHAGEDAGTVIIEFIGGFEGDDVEKTFNITPKQITDPDDPDTGLDIEPRSTEEDPIVVPDKGDGSNPDLMPIEIKDKETGETLTNPEDFEIVIDDEEGHAHIEFKGDYEGTPDIPLFYEVQEVKVNIPTQPFSGEEVKPHPEVTFAGETLTEGVDYVVYYGNNTEPGVGKAIIQFIGEYADVQTRTVEFDIKGTRLDNSATNADGRSTVVVVNDEGFDPEISLYAKLVEDVPQDIKDQAALGGRFYGTYGDYEIKLFDKDGNEVQPSDIKEGTVLTLMIQLPDELQGRDVKLVHYHSADDISVIVKGDEAGIGTYVITEEGYIVTQINKFSNFSLIYEETCLAHWFMITAAVLNILLVASVIIMGKKQSKALGIGAIVGLAVMSGVGAIFAHCMICWVMLGINGAMILFDILFFCLWKGKEEPQAPQAQPQVVYVQQPAPQQVIVQQVAAPAPAAEPAPAPAPVQEAPQEALTLKESMAKAAEVVSELKVTKEVVAKYLESKYPNNTIVNRKANYTKTGLPLADTHYVLFGENKKCFIYVYELDSEAFFIVRTTEEIANAIAAKHPLTAPSAFPATRDGGKWFAVMFDDSYKSIDDVNEVIDMVIAGYGAEAVQAEEPKEPLSLKESMAQAAAVASELHINKDVVAKYLSENHKANVEVNRKPNFTKTGLPLADTHYVLFGENMRKCFMYVYEVNDEAFFIVRTSEDVYKAIKAKHASVAPSAFPATRDGGKWFTVMFDKSFKSNEDVYDVIEMVLASYDNYVPEEKPEPVKEPEPVVEPAPVPEVVEEDEEGIAYKYIFSFSARLIRAGDDRQDFYNAIKNHALSYKKVASKISWGHELIKLGRIKICELKVKGKTLCVYLPLDPDKYDQERMFYQDMRVEGKEVEFPMMLKVKSDRGVKYACELIDEVMKNNEIPHNDNYEEQDYRLPHMSIEEMLTSDPVLAKLTDGSEVPVPEKKPEPKPEPVKVEEPAPVVVEEEDAGFDYKYSFSFSARLIRAGQDRQDLYNAIKNDILAYKKVASKISWGHELFKLGRIKLAQIKVKGKTLCVYLPLDPDKYDADRLFFKDMRVEGKEVEFPMMMKVKSDRAVKYVAELMRDVMANNGIVRVEDYVEQDYRLPEMSLEKMLKEGLAKDLTK